MRVPIRKPGKYTHQKSDIHITEKKLQEFKVELKKIKQVVQPKLIIEVKRLAELGDFSENTEYQIAKGRLRGLNARIDELEDAIKKAKLITFGAGSEIATIGSKVILELNGVKKEYLILGSAESDPTKGIISHTSPIGAALIGKKVGDIFSIEIANKKMEGKILKIS